MTQERIRVYGALWCPDCLRTRRFLIERKVPFDWIDVQEHPEELIFVREKNAGMESIPTILFPDGSTLTEPSDEQLARKLRLTS